MIQGMEAAQRAQDRKEHPSFYAGDEETKVHSSSLSGLYVMSLTKKFIEELSDADHNRIEELFGYSPSDLELIYPIIAKQYKDLSAEIDASTDMFFWDKCKTMALNAYDNGYLDL